jgi:hypothetical protein
MLCREAGETASARLGAPPLSNSPYWPSIHPRSSNRGRAGRENPGFYTHPWPTVQSGRQGLRHGAAQLGRPENEGASVPWRSTVSLATLQSYRPSILNVGRCFLAGPWAPRRDIQRDWPTLRLESANHGNSLPYRDRSRVPRHQRNRRMSGMWGSSPQDISRGVWSIVNPGGPVAERSQSEFPRTTGHPYFPEKETFLFYLDTVPRSHDSGVR